MEVVTNMHVCKKHSMDHMLNWGHMLSMQLKHFKELFYKSREEYWVIIWDWLKMSVLGLTSIPLWTYASQEKDRLQKSERWWDGAGWHWQPNLKHNGCTHRTPQHPPKNTPRGPAHKNSTLLCNASQPTPNSYTANSDTIQKKTKSLPLSVLSTMPPPQHLGHLSHLSRKW